MNIKKKPYKKHKRIPFNWRRKALTQNAMCACATMQLERLPKGLEK